MYKLPIFEEKDADKVLAFMQAHSFITLIGSTDEFPVATQVPVHIGQDEKGMRLVGHVMKKTDHFEAFLKNDKVLALFTGAHTYVSASVYEKPAVASTWNYSSVQAKGTIRIMDNDETRAVIKQITDHYEDPATSPAAFHKMTDEYIESNLKAISGFEISVASIQHVFKLSQNHPTANREKIVADLSKTGNPNSIEVARQMREKL